MTAMILMYVCMYVCMYACMHAQCLSSQVVPRLKCHGRFVEVTRFRRMEQPTVQILSQELVPQSGMPTAHAPQSAPTFFWLLCAAERGTLHCGLSSDRMAACYA